MLRSVGSNPDQSKCLDTLRTIKLMGLFARSEFRIAFAYLGCVRGRRQLIQFPLKPAMQKLIQYLSIKSLRVEQFFQRLCSRVLASRRRVGRCREGNCLTGWLVDSSDKKDSEGSSRRKDRIASSSVLLSLQDFY